jgi:hypothetical protein
MPDIDITQAEADALIAMPKVKVDDQKWEYPTSGRSISMPLASSDKREAFFLDIHRGRIDLRKGTYQNRAHQAIVLVRLDFGGRPHRNPDGEEIPSPHLHRYREGFGDKWAVLAPMDRFPDLGDLWRTLQDFMLFCNIVEPPLIEKGLFV